MLERNNYNKQNTVQSKEIWSSGNRGQVPGLDKRLKFSLIENNNLKKTLERYERVWNSDSLGE